MRPLNRSSIIPNRTTGSSIIYLFRVSPERPSGRYLSLPSFLSLFQPCSSSGSDSGAHRGKQTNTERTKVDNLVQSCWNGIAVLDPEPFYQPPHVKFRMARLPDGECSASECSLICSKSPPSYRCPHVGCRLAPLRGPFPRMAWSRNQMFALGPRA
jgi:hypothetical protein